MKKIIQLCGILAVVLLCSFAPGAWVAYESKAGGYKVSMPGKAQENSQAVETAVGTLTMNMAMLQSDDNDVKMFMSVYSDYPDSILNGNLSKDDLEEFFNSTIAGAARNVGGTTVKKEVISYKNYPGRHAVINIEDKGATFEMNVFLVRNRIYILQVGYMTGAKNLAAVKQFYSSFQLTAAK